MRDIGRQVLHRLHQLPVNSLGDDLRLRHRQLITFAPHHLDQDGKLQFAAAEHFEIIRSRTFFHFQRYVRQQLFFQPLPQIT
jgi:hypothetical protein